MEQVALSNKTMKKKINPELNKGEIIIYQAKKGPQLEVRLEKDTVWLDAHLVANLFDIDRTVIVKHIGNIYKTAELSEKATCAKIAQVAADGKLRKMNLYNLDMILSVGYRVNSKRATQFRIWATKTLKNHLIEGYTINENRLLKAQNHLTELQNTIDFLQNKAHHALVSGQAQEILHLLADYAKTLTLLDQYDKEKLSLIKKGKGKYILTYPDAQRVIQEIKTELITKKEASHLFGQETDQKFQSILGNLYQTFRGKELYSSLEEKAAHLLYFVIKDHPFVDGNKRIASFLFVYFLDKNKYLYHNTGARKINDVALTALSLLIAISEPKEKDRLIKIITNLLTI